MPSDTSVRMRSFSSISASDVAHPAHGLGQPLLDVEGLEQLDLAVHGQVGRVAGGVGNRTGLGDGLEQLHEAPDAAALEDVLHDQSVLGGQLGRPRRVAAGLVGPLERHPESLAGAGHPGADDGPVQAPHDHGADAARQLAGVLHAGDGPDPGVSARAGHIRGSVGSAWARQTGHEHDEVVSALGCVCSRQRLGGLQGECDDHAGKNDAGIDRQQGER